MSETNLTFDDLLKINPNLLPDGTEFNARIVDGGPVVQGSYDKYQLDWQVTDDGPNKGRKFIQKLGLDGDRLDRTFKALKPTGVTEANILTAKPEHISGTITLGIAKPYTNHEGKTVVTNYVKWFNASRAAGPVDEGLKNRLQAILARRAGRKSGGMEASAFGGDEGDASFSPDDFS